MQSKRTSHSTVVILDFGSQYTQLIARRVRELHVYSVILPGSVSLENLKAHAPSAVILSGGPASVYEEGSVQIASGFWEEQEKSRFPVLGICYGMQLLAHGLGGEVKPAKKREYGRMDVKVEKGGSTLLSSLSKPRFQAWMSHGDETVRLPSGFKVTARSQSGALAAIECEGRKLYGLQFHPEVTHTECGLQILEQFLFQCAKITPDWTMANVLKEEVERIRALVGEKAHVLCALSGGVDSAVAAALLDRAIGKRLHCVFVDNGLLRFEERSRVMATISDYLHLSVRAVDAKDRFLSKLKGVADPEKKRKIIGAEFIAVFEEASRDIAREIGQEPEFLVQGTLYPDVIESSPAEGAASELGGGRTHSATIKSHHNVGGLPANLRFKLIEPLRNLFKDEVRELGRELKVPSPFLKRHPFPGPGLAVRVIGAVTEPHLEILRLVDEIFIEEIKKAGLYDRIWQAFAVFLPVKTVGVQGDGRTHDHVIALRAVTSSDGMTADWYPFEVAFLARVSNRICNEVRGVNRVVYDVSSKPPATIEWE